MSIGVLMGHLSEVAHQYPDTHPLISILSEPLSAILSEVAECTYFVCIKMYTSTCIQVMY